jgi:hypothetical protein
VGILGIGLWDVVSGQKAMTTTKQIEADVTGIITQLKPEEVRKLPLGGY